MKKKDLFKINEGLLLFAVGCCLENQPVRSILLVLAAAGMSAVLFHPHKEDLYRTLEFTMVILLPFCMSGLLQEVPLLSLCVSGCAFISILWNKYAKKTAHEENGIIISCLGIFLLLSLLIKGVFYGTFNTMMISTAVFGPHAALCLFDDIKIRKRIVKKAKAY